MTTQNKRQKKNASGRVESNVDVDDWPPLQKTKKNPEKTGKNFTYTIRYTVYMQRKWNV